VQDSLAALLSSGAGNLCVVGDDDQSIYGWRGAEVRNILQFPCDKRITLEQNYRSTNTILRAANAVIDNNNERHEKQMWSAQGEGEKIHFHSASDDVREAEWVVHQLVEMKLSKGLPWSDFAIMYRSNALSRQFEIALAKYLWNDGGELIRGIPYEVYGGTAFYARKEVKDIFGYLRVIANPRDQGALIRVINQPRRGIGEGTLDALTSACRQNKSSLWDALHNLPSNVSARAKGGITEFLSVVETARNHFENEPLDQALEWLIGRIQYKKAIEDEVKSPQMRQYKWENVQELVSAAAEFGEGKERATLQDFVTSSPLGEEEQQHKKKKKGSSVSLLTVHSSKGLEWPSCYLVGMEDHIIPHQKSLCIEEERRLMYVAITRAQRHLVLTAARVRNRMGRPSPSKPSRFLYEIPKELLHISKG
jgi:DNA helicase-2/ATP-dependent DNA helicase PcrA